MSAEEYRDLGRRDGEEAGARALQVLPPSDVPGRFVRAVERELAELDHIAADALELGASATAVELYKAAWRTGLCAILDELGAALLATLPDEYEEAGDH